MPPLAITASISYRPATSSGWRPAWLTAANPRSRPPPQLLPPYKDSGGCRPSGWRYWKPSIPLSFPPSGGAAGVHPGDQALLVCDPLEQLCEALALPPLERGAQRLLVLPAGARQVGHHRAALAGEMQGVDAAV